MATALRETWEEIGLDRDSIEILEPLPPIETRTTGFRIQPFVARIRRPERWTLDAREIDEVIEVRVADLLRPEAHGETIETFPTWPEPQRVPFYRVGQHRLWGATYGILQPILNDIAADRWKV